MRLPEHFFAAVTCIKEILQPDLQCDDLTVIRHIQFSPVIGLSFCRIERLAFRDLFIFGVPQKQMGDFKLLAAPRSLLPLQRQRPL